jgi:hypothetical protein
VAIWRMDWRRAVELIYPYLERARGWSQPQPRAVIQNAPPTTQRLPERSSYPELLRTSSLTEYSLWIFHTLCVQIAQYGVDLHSHQDCRSRTKPLLSLDLGAPGFSFSLTRFVGYNCLFLQVRLLYKHGYSSPVAEAILHTSNSRVRRVVRRLKC